MFACIPISFRGIRLSYRSCLGEELEVASGTKGRGSKTAQCCAVKLDAGFIWSMTFISEVLVIVTRESWDGLKQLANRS